MSSTLIKRVLIFIVFTVLAVADFSLGLVGINKGISLSLFLFIYLLIINRVYETIYFFTFGFILDLVSTISPFGFFSLMFTTLGIINKWLVKNVPQEFLGLGYYVFCTIIFNVLFNKINLSLIFISIVSYFIFRIFSLLVFKK